MALFMFLVGALIEFHSLGAVTEQTQLPLRFSGDCRMAKSNWCKDLRDLCAE